MTAVETLLPDVGQSPAGAAVHRSASTRRRRLPVGLVLTLICGLWAVPLVGLFVTSMRTDYDAARSGWWTAITDPTALTLDNYRDAMATSGLLDALVNSAIVAVPAVTAMMTVGSIAAFGLARLELRGRRLMVAATLVLAVVPVQIVLVPTLRLYDRAGLAGTYLGTWLVHVALGLPFAIYLLRSFFASLPDDLFHAAALDGATMLDAFIRIALPLSRPALASVAIFQFIWVWNDLLVALIFLGGDPTVAPATVTMANLVNSTTGQGTQRLAAAAFISMSVPLVVFFAFQRSFVRGLLAGGLK